MNLLAHALFVLNCIAAVLLWKRETRLLASHVFSPSLVLLGSLQSIYIVEALGIIKYRHVNGEGLLMYEVGVALLTIGYAVGLRAAATNSPSREQKRSSAGLPKIYLYAGLGLSTFGYLGVIYNIYSFGFAYALQGVEEYHNEKLGSTDTMQQIAELSYVCGMFLILASVHYKGEVLRLRGWFLYILGLTVVCGLTFLSGGRASLFFMALVTILTIGTIRHVRLSVVAPVVLVIVIILAATTVRRVSYMGHQASERLLNYFGAEGTAIPGAMLTETSGLLAINVLTYWTASLNTFCLIWDRQDVLERGAGLYSVRFINPVVAALDASAARRRSDAYAGNSEYLRSIYGAGNQWPTAMGYFLLDWGAGGLVLGSLIYGLAVGVVARKATECSGGARYLFLNSAYLCGVVAIMMPLTAIRAFFFTFIVLVVTAEVVRRHRI